MIYKKERPSSGDGLYRYIVFSGSVVRFIADGSPQRLFDAADPVLAILAAYGRVGAAPEAFRVPGVDDLPADQHYAGHEKQAPGEKAADEQQGREHHEPTPVEDAAADAAVVLHDKRLEGTEHDHAGGIAGVVEYRQQDQLFGVQYAQQVEQPEDAVEYQPHQHDLPGLDVHVLHVFQQLQPVKGFLRFPVGLGQGFAHAHGLTGTGQHMDDHFQHQQGPQHRNQRHRAHQPEFGEHGHQIGPENIHRQHAQENRHPKQPAHEVSSEHSVVFYKAQVHDAAHRISRKTTKR